MVLAIPDKILEKGSLTEEMLCLELAIILFKNYTISLGQAAKVARLHKLMFQKELAKRKIPIHYDVVDFERDMEQIKQLKRWLLNP